MKKSQIITIVDIAVYLINDILAWFIVIWFNMTGYDCKFQDLTFHRILLLIAIVHIVLSIFFSVFFYTKERTRYKIRIGKKLLIYDIVMTLIPYLFFLAVDM